MNEEAQRIAIAEACGWTNITSDCVGNKPHGRGNADHDFIPDYLHDLNAMHKAEQMLSYEPDYMFFLRYVVGDFSEAQSEWTDYDWYRVAHATAAQRAEAFLRTIGKWTEVAHE